MRTHSPTRRSSGSSTSAPAPTRTASRSSVPNPQPIFEMQFSLVPARILATAVQLELFSRLADGAKTVAEVARAAHTSERGTRMLLDALAAIQLIAKSNGRYRLSPLAAEFLVKERPNYVGWMMERDEMWQAWSRLPEAVQTGKPLRQVEQESEAAAFFPWLVRSLHIMNREPAHRSATALVGTGKRTSGLRVLDVACGSGVWGIAIAQTDRRARITAHDFSTILPITREYVEREHLSDRFEYLEGNLKTVEFGQNTFDLAILGNIVHSEGAASSRALFRRLHRALAPGGRIAIVDMLPNPDRSGPPFPVFFALIMLLNTYEGDTYTLPEYTRWLTETGFDNVTTTDIGSHSPLIIAVRR